MWEIHSHSSISNNSLMSWQPYCLACIALNSLCFCWSALPKLKRNRKKNPIPVKHNGKCLCVNVCTNIPTYTHCVLFVIVAFILSELKIFSLAKEIWIERESEYVKGLAFIIYGLSSGWLSLRCHNIVIFGRSLSKSCSRWIFYFSNLLWVIV